MPITTDPNDPRLGHGSDTAPCAQNEAYLVLTEEERAKGFVRPYRDSYVHVGERPEFELLDLSAEQTERYASYGYVKYEAYPESMRPLVGRYWTQKQLDAAVRPCNGVTTMGRAIAETYATNPKFYGSTYCMGCMMHRPVAEFVWAGTDQQVGS